MTLRVLHLVGSAVSDFLGDLSRLYAMDCLAATADAARYEFHIAYVTPDLQWRFPADLSREAIRSATPMPLAEAVGYISGLDFDVGVPQMFCLPGMTIYRALLDVLGIPYLGNTPDVMALGADWCNAARGFMFAVGCIQAQQCHTGSCPTGVTSQDRSRQRAVVVSDKSRRVANFHRETVKALAELVGAAGLDHPSQLRPQHFMRRAAADRVVTFAELYRFLAPGELLSGTTDPRFRDAWAMARADSFAPTSTTASPGIAQAAE